VVKVNTVKQYTLVFDLLLQHVMPRFHVQLFIYFTTEAKQSNAIR